MGSYQFKSLYDGSSRPAWAGNVLITTEDAKVQRAQSDARKVQDDHLERPISVAGVVVPVSTPGRSTPDVPNRDLEGRPEDRGHLMALSLGGPNDPLNMVPQPRQLNQKLEESSVEQSHLGEFTWRGMEIYCCYLATQVLSATAFKSEWTDKLTVHTIKSRLQNKTRLFECDGNKVELMQSGSVAPVTPAFVLFYQAEPRYRDNRGNSPTEITVTVSIRKRADHSTTLLFSKKYSMQFQQQDFALLDQRIKKKAEHDAEFRVSKKYKEERLRPKP